MNEDRRDCLEYQNNWDSSDRYLVKETKTFGLWYEQTKKSKQQSGQTM
jgi:hypothetical protein